MAHVARSRVGHGTLFGDVSDAVAVIALFLGALATQVRRVLADETRHFAVGVGAVSGVMAGAVAVEAFFRVAILPFRFLLAGLASRALPCGRFGLIFLHFLVVEGTLFSLQRRLCLISL